jgi:sodium/potassium-transporting ATPase subunit alpha
MNFAILFEIALAAFFVYTPGLHSALKFSFLRPELWIPPIPFAFYAIFYDEIRKLGIRRSSWAAEELTT